MVPVATAFGRGWTHWPCGPRTARRDALERPHRKPCLAGLECAANAVAKLLGAPAALAEGPGYIARVSTTGGFWARRLRWRLIGAWRWPLYVAITVIDALVVVWLPPNGHDALFVPALVICSFANLFLIGVIAPWLARRIVARPGEKAPSSTFPPANHLEVLTDRIAAIALVLATVGLL